MIVCLLQEHTDIKLFKKMILFRMEYSIAIFNMDKFDFEIIERPNNI